jgi:glycosyltransferase involved in cell wall biosynthesis
MRDRINLMLWYWGRRGFPVRLADDLTRHLGNRDDVELTVSLSRQSEGFAARWTDEASGFHVDMFRSAASMPAALLRFPRQRRALLDFARANEIEVVFALMRHPFSPWVFRALRHQKQRVLLVVHDALPHPGDSFPFWHQHFRLDLKATDGIVVMSEAVAETMARVYNYPVDRTFFMPLPAPDFPRRQYPRTPPHGRPWRLMFFGRILEYKGLDLLSKAYALLHDRFSISLRIVGEGHVEALDSLARLPGVTIEQRWVPDTEVATLLDQTDIIVLPYTEASQSGVLVTALAVGVPAVATPVGGLKEQIVSRTTGLLADTATPQGFADAIATLILDPELYTSCSTGAIAAAAGTYDTERAAQAVLKASRTVCGLPQR